VPGCGGALLPRIVGLDIAVKSWVNVRHFEMAAVRLRLHLSTAGVSRFDRAQARRPGVQER